MTQDFRQCEDWKKAQRGEMYTAFIPELIKARERSVETYERFNNATDTSRRSMVKLFREFVMDDRPLPPKAATQEEDDALFENEPWVAPPIVADYGCNIFLGERMFLNTRATFVDTCPISIGARTLVGPGCSFYSGSHPIDPAVRNGLLGPESGKPIVIEDDCWLGGNVVVLPGVTIGRGSTVGAGSVVTKNVPPFHVVAGNPARIIRKIESAWNPESSTDEVPASDEVLKGPESAMAKATPAPLV